MQAEISKDGTEIEFEKALRGPKSGPDKTRFLLAKYQLASSFTKYK